MESTMARVGRVLPIIVSGCMVFFTVTCTTAQQIPQTSRPTRAPASSPKPPDADAAKTQTESSKSSSASANTPGTIPVDVTGASAQNIQRIIEKLVSFGN